MEYFTVLHMFISSVFFNKDEMSFKSKNFNPLKIVVIAALLVNVWFSFYLLSVLSRAHDRIEQECPKVFVKKEKT
jgi:hypothetical protein